MRHQGRITNWKDDQGFGFIVPNGGGEPVFVHVKAFSNQRRRPLGNDIVTYELAADQKGRARAENVAFVEQRPAVAAATGSGSGSLVLAVFFVVFVAALAFAGKLPAKVFALYVAASGVAFVVYAKDKSAARNNRWRTKESTLHLIALLGGWPGALFAQKLLRHKTRKPLFQVIFWATVLLNCGALGWLLTPKGSGVLRSALGGVT